MKLFFLFLISPVSATVKYDWTFNCDGCGNDELTTVPQKKPIRLVWNSGFHDVLQFPDEQSFKNCDFSNAIQPWEGSGCTRGGQGDCTLPTRVPETYYYGCSVGPHCARGNMKFAIEVISEESIEDNEDE